MGSCTSINVGGKFKDGLRQHTIEDYTEDSSGELRSVGHTTLVSCGDGTNYEVFYDNSGRQIGCSPIESIDNRKYNGGPWPVSSTTRRV